MLFGCLIPYATADCFDDAARHRGLSADLLRGISHVESSGCKNNYNRTHRQRTGSYDIGCMQINSRWLPMLAKHNITENDLLDPCTNIHVGAWILSDLIHRMGDTWNAVGALNAACTQLKGDACSSRRSEYAWKVYNAMRSGRAK